MKTVSEVDISVIVYLSISIVRSGRLPNPEAVLSLVAKSGELYAYMSELEA